MEFLKFPLNIYLITILSQSALISLSFWFFKIKFFQFSLLTPYIHRFNSISIVTFQKCNKFKKYKNCYPKNNQLYCPSVCVCVRWIATFRADIVYIQFIITRSSYNKYFYNKTKIPSLAVLCDTYPIRFICVCKETSKKKTETHVISTWSLRGNCAKQPNYVTKKKGDRNKITYFAFSS